MRAVYARSHTIGGVAIRWCTWFAPWSHGGVVTTTGWVVNARAFHGVVVEPLEDFLQRYSKHEFVDIPVPDEQAAIERAMSMVGYGYDYGGVARFVSRWAQRLVAPLLRAKKPRASCIAVIESAAAAGGRQRHRVAPDAVTPQQSYITR